MATNANKITLAKIDAEIGTFTTNRETLKNLGHTIAMMIFMHAAPKEISDDCNGTGDCTRALTLHDELPKSWAPQFKTWLGLYTPIRLNSSAGNVGYDPKYKKLSAEEKLSWWKLEEANTNPFWTTEEEREPKAFDFKAMKKMIERLPDQIAKKIEKGLVPADDLASAMALIDKLEGFTVTRVKTTSKPKTDGANDSTTDIVQGVTDEKAAAA